MKASIADMKAKNEQLLADNASYRERERTRKQSEEERRKKEGDFEPLLKSKEEEIAKLSSRLSELEPIASRWQERQEAEAKSIAEAAMELSEAARAALSGVSDITQRRVLLDELLAAKRAGATPAPKERPTAPPGVAPPSGGEPTEADLYAGKISVDEVRTNHPGLWEKVRQKFSPPTSPILAQFGHSKK